MGISLVIVGKLPMNMSHSVVQARMYAQALTLGVLVVSAGFEMDDVGRARGHSVPSEDPSSRVEASARKKNYEGQDLWQGQYALIR